MLPCYLLPLELYELRLPAQPCVLPVSTMAQQALQGPHLLSVHAEMTCLVFTVRQR